LPAAVALPAFDILPAAVALPAFDILPAAVALPAFDILPEAVLFVILPPEVMLPDFIVELLVWFPAIEVAPRTEAAEAEVTNIMLVATAKANPKLLYIILFIPPIERRPVL